MTHEQNFRIGVGGFHIECSSFNPVLTTDADFTMLSGDALLNSPYFAALTKYSAHFVPTHYAHALPGGPVAARTYQAIKSQFISGLRNAAPLDGVYLMLHGAAYVEGLTDAEGDLLTAVRSAVGPDVPISVSYDLHGNLSDRVMDAVDMFAAYRTAPHVDVTETHYRALDQLFRCLRTGVRPCLCWCPIPVVLPGERTSTQDEPARGLYAGLSEWDAADGIWDASLMVGYVWVDEPRMTAAAVLVGTDRGAMAAAATQLAQSYWDARSKFTFGCDVGTIEQCLAAAAQPGPTPFVLADSGDNPTGGGVGDRIDVLRARMGEDGGDVILAGIADAPATAAAFEAGEGARIGLRVGGSLDADTTPLGIQAQVVRLLAGQMSGDRQAVVECAGRVLVLTEKRRPFHTLQDFHRLGLDPHTARLVVVKSGYLVPQISGLAARSMMALSPGVVDQAIERQPRSNCGPGLYPFDPSATYTPAVRWTRRSLTPP